MSQFVEGPLAPQHLLMMTDGMEDGERLLGMAPQCLIKVDEILNHASQIQQEF